MDIDKKVIAKSIDHSLLHPTMTEDDFIIGCKTALKWDVASVCIKPYAVKTASQLLKGSDVKVCTVVGFPHGSVSNESKFDETKIAIKNGATEIDMVVNIGKVLSNDWTYVKHEVETINSICLDNGAILKVIFENDYLPLDSYKIALTEMCRTIGVAFVKTSTGYGYTKQEDGSFSAKGATLHDCKLMVAYAGPKMQVKAAGGIRTFKDLLAFREIGVTRIGATATESIMNECLGNSPHTQENKVFGY